MKRQSLSLKSKHFEISKQFGSTRSIEEKVVAALKDENINTIGICGVGCVDKTAMARQIGEEVKREKMFTSVVMVSVGQSYDPKRIVYEISNYFGVRFDRENFEATANQLLFRLMMEERILIILDDVWEVLEVEKLGIPLQYKRKGSCKILITSTLDSVCLAMGAHEIFDVQGLTKMKPLVSATYVDSDLYARSRARKQWAILSAAVMFVARISRQSRSHARRMAEFDVQGLTEMETLDSFFWANELLASTTDFDSDLTKMRPLVSATYVDSDLYPRSRARKQWAILSAVVRFVARISRTSSYLARMSRQRRSHAGRMEKLRSNRRETRTKILQRPEPSLVSTNAFKSERKRDFFLLDTGSSNLRDTSSPSTSSQSEGQKKEKIQKVEINHEAKSEVSIDVVICNDRYMKNCILFCSVFPSDYEFTKDMLVWQWIAEGLIKFENDETMEELCVQFFDILLKLNYIVPSGYDHYLDQMKYKVGDEMNAFFQNQNQLLGPEFAKHFDCEQTDVAKVEHLSLMKYKVGDEMNAFLQNQNQLLGPEFAKHLDCEQTDVAKVEHLSLAFKEIDDINFETLKQCSGLQTLIIHRCYGSEVKYLPSDLFLELKALKILKLSHTNILELPSSIENLKALRHLDMSDTPMRWLPESIHSLSNLQTLNLDGCLSLIGLPKSTNKLINLRHLVLDVVRQLQSMPTGIGKLSKLRTLRAFLVGEEDGNRIGELKNMNKLKGSIGLLNLENVMTKEEAAEAWLCDKQDLKKIELQWSDSQNEKNPDEEEILKCLQPPLGIEELKIIFYSGGVLPGWISNPSFSEVVSILLYKCRYCDSLPSLGELPSLKFLSIVEMNELIEISSLFYRKQGNEHHLAFPKLEKLKFVSMSNLEKWTGMKNTDFPHLRHLIIEYCPKFVGLPLLSHLNSLLHMEISYCPELSCLPEGGLPPTLESLMIKGCPKLKARCCNEQCEDWSKVANVGALYIDNQKVFVKL